MTRDLVDCLRRETLGRLRATAAPPPIEQAYPRTESVRVSRHTYFTATLTAGRIPRFRNL